MKTKALFFDIDGTLVSFRTHVIPDSTVRALERAKAAGIGIYISTGRPVPLIVNLGQIQHLIDGYISTTGALCFVGQQTVSCTSISLADVHRVLDACRRMDKPCVVVGEEHVGVLNINAEVDQAFRVGLGLNDFVFADVEDVLHEPILQLTPFFTEEDERAVMPTLEACTSGRWIDNFCDITHRDADKGKALVTMAEYLGIKIEETMAFGDGGNDITILRQAGIGVAMGNANDEVKQAADFVTRSVDEDGVAYALERFLGI